MTTTLPQSTEFVTHGPATEAQRIAGIREDIERLKRSLAEKKRTLGEMQTRWKSLCAVAAMSEKRGENKYSLMTVDERSWATGAALAIELLAKDIAGIEKTITRAQASIEPGWLERMATWIRP